MLGLGFRVKSGRAIAIALNGPASGPTPFLRRDVELCDPDVPGTRQPYHAAFGTARVDEAAVAALVAIVERTARRSIADLLQVDGLRSACERAVLVVGSVIDPALVNSPHIRAHASEGRLFRAVVEDALRAHGITAEVIVEKRLAAEAAARLGREPAEITRMVSALGRALDGPWRADEKSAAIAAWIALAPAKPR